ncbi:class E sortase [Pedobacter sp.]|nr:class E sortase [Candidatus Saccharibacteria bacterium]
MKYNYRNGVGGLKKHSKIWIVFPILGILAGLYVLLNALSPAISTPFDTPSDTVAKKLTQQQPQLDQNRLYIPQINVDVAVVTGPTDASLELGAWHRKPENGDPKNGGNFVLSAHRFNLGILPSQTRAKSPFYHIDKLKEGDELYVDFEGVRYAYSVTRSYKVARTAIEIEQRTDENKMTLYSCDLRGEKAGREVVEAKPIGTVAWDENGPKLKSL